MGKPKDNILEKQAFKTLFDTYFEEVRRYVFYRSGNEDLSTDIAQDTFIRIWEKQNDIDPKRVKGLLFKIANDLFISSYRKDKVAFNFFKNYEVQEQSQTPYDDISYEELKSAYETALNNLPEKQRVVFLMSRIDELKYKEIAERLDLSVKAVEKRMSQALDHMKHALRKYSSTLILWFITGFKYRAEIKKTK